MGLKRNTRLAVSAARVMMGLLPHSTAPESVVEIALNCAALTTAQVGGELVQLARLIARYRPRRVLEIGTSNGGTLLVLARLADPQATIITIDLPGGRFGDTDQALRCWLIPRLKEPGQKLHFLQVDSHLGAARESVANILAGEKIDCLFIDGDHTYPGVRQDFEMYSPFVRSGGLVAFHDILEHPENTEVQVAKFWHEIKGRHSHLEFVENPAQGWAGIGVLFL